MPAILNRRDHGETISHERKRSRVNCSVSVVPEARLIELARRYERGEELFPADERNDHPESLSPALHLGNESDPPDYDSEPGGAGDFSFDGDADGD